MHRATVLICLIMACSLGCSDEAIDPTTPSESGMISGTVEQSDHDVDALEETPVPHPAEFTQDPMEQEAIAEEEQALWAEDVDDMVNEMGLFDVDGHSDDVIRVGPSSPPEEFGNFVCTSQSVSQTVQFNEYIASQVNSNALWVGALVRGQALETGMLTEVNVPRTPITVSVSLDSLNGPSSMTIDEPSLSSYRDSVRELLTDGIEGSQPAQVVYSADTVHSEEHLDVFLGADVSAGSVDVAASFDFSRSDVRSRMLVNFVQAYYTVDMDAIGRPSGFFEPLTDIDALDQAFGGDEAEAPLYVSSITYGRRVMFTVESTASSQELKAALDFAYRGAVAEVDVNARMSHSEVLRESRIQAFIIGGNADDAVEAVDGLEGIQTFITEGGTYSPESPGAPIAYKLNHLKDNSAARLSLTTEYSKDTCLRVRQNVQVTLKGITPVDGQNRAKTYGKIFARSFDADGNEARRHTLFNVHKDNRIEMRENVEWQPSSIGTSGVLPAIASVDADSSIHISVELTEYDWGGRDDATLANLMIPQSAGWRHGCGQGEDLVIRSSGRRQSYDIRLCLQPMAD